MKAHTAVNPTLKLARVAQAEALALTQNNAKAITIISAIYRIKDVLTSEQLTACSEKNLMKALRIYSEYGINKTKDFLPVDRACHQSKNSETIKPYDRWHFELTDSFVSFKTFRAFDTLCASAGNFYSLDKSSTGSSSGITCPDCLINLFKIIELDERLANKLAEVAA